MTLIILIGDTMDTKPRDTTKKTSRFVDILLLILAGCGAYYVFFWLPVHLLSGEAYKAFTLVGLVAVMYYTLIKKKNSKD